MEDVEEEATTGLPTGTIVLMTVGIRPQVTQSEAEFENVVPSELVVLPEDMEQDEHCVVLVTVPTMTAGFGISVLCRL